MINKIIEYLSNKKIAILGFGVEGISTYNFIRRHSNITLTIVDKNKISENIKNTVLKNDQNLCITTGDDYLNNINSFDLVIKSPGIAIYDEIKRNKITSQLDIILKFNKENIIGITGTKGKSTTSSLVYEVLKANNRDCLLVGNIGTPIFDELEAITEQTILVTEMSSHQLQYVDNSPKIAVLLNLLEDHLDYCKTVEAYHSMKLNIFKYQEKNDYSIYFDDFENVHTYLENKSFVGTKIKLRLDDNLNSTLYVKNNFAYFNNIKIYDLDTKTNLIGSHNLRDILVVLSISQLLDLNLKKSINTITVFNTLEHRMEYVETIGSVSYYNDSISTIPESTIYAIEALKNVNSLIFGGLDRGINYNNFINYLNTGVVKNLICLPNTGHIISHHITSNDITCHLVQNMCEAVLIAKKVTKKDTICLLSPAAASYEHYKNFKEKGCHFKELIKQL